jgi:four helix bundle protein
MTEKSKIVQKKSYQFSLDIINLYKELNSQKEYILSKQLLRSGTSIGANVEESSAAQSTKDFIAKMAIASKEARETNYWLRLLRDSKVVNNIDFAEIINDSEELIKIITSIVKTSQNKLRNS